MNYDYTQPIDEIARAIRESFLSEEFVGPGGDMLNATEALHYIAKNLGSVAEALQQIANAIERKTL